MQLKEKEERATALCKSNTHSDTLGVGCIDKYCPQTITCNGVITVVFLVSLEQFPE